MEIKRFINSAVASDGGTIMCRVELADGTELDMGLDGRIPKHKKERVLFLGAYPADPKSRLLVRGSQEEEDLIASVQRYIDRTCSFIRRESLDMTNPTTLNEADQSDWMAIKFMKAIIDR